MSDQPKTTEKKDAQETTEPTASSSQPNIGLISTEIPKGTKNSKGSKTSKGKEDPKNAETFKGPGTSKSFENFKGTEAPKGSKTPMRVAIPKFIEPTESTKSRNRRFKKPEKLVLSAADDAFLSILKSHQMEDVDKEDVKEEEVKMKAQVTSPAKRLFNFVKYNQSHSWVWYEFGESVVDTAVQCGTYGMSSCMLEYSPLLQTRLMPRRGWQMLRRALGKARNFSPAFIESELKELNRSRQFVRKLQQGKPVKREEHGLVEQLYRDISLPLAVNDKVTTFLKGTGIVNGVIARFNPEDSTYVVRCVLNRKTVDITVPDILIQSLEDFVGLPIEHVMKSIDPNQHIFKMDAIVKGKGHYSKELLGAMVKVKKLLAMKAKAVQDLAAKNDNRDKAPKQRKGQGSYLGANFTELHRINADVEAPMRILHEYQRQYERKMKLQEIRACTALERYLMCCHRADLDLQNVANRIDLKVNDPTSKALYQDLQTILYLTGELGAPNTEDMMIITDNLIAYMIKTLPPELSAQFEITMNELKPYRQRVVEKLKKLREAEQAEGSSDQKSTDKEKA
ncbi:uncharacterized protein LOC110180436 [Drosophila serrata]|uniref:uncharacterized protein LOC110180436 n=1 Tax=Drosophila serrata TaxID=7274 RepID=UPI000A1CF556|nr:uncharacterized protein LOC110180436 [Drosophila serrata]XP_020803767.1 uncharacterized protein LOC110180436 [Drosophila serrata]